MSKGIGPRRITALQRRIIDAFEADPDTDPRIIAARLGCAPSSAYNARKLWEQLKEESAAKEGTLSHYLDAIANAVLSQHARLHVDDLLVTLAFVNCVLRNRVHVGQAIESPAVGEAVRVYRQQHQREPSAEWIMQRSEELAKSDAGRARVESAFAARGYRLRLQEWPELAAFARALAEPTEATAFYQRLGSASPFAAAKAALAAAVPQRDYPSKDGLFDPRAGESPLPDAPEREAAVHETPDEPPDPALLELAALSPEDQETLRQLSVQERAELEHAQ